PTHRRRRVPPGARGSLMEAVLFLLIAVGVVVVGTTVLLIRAREPKGEYRGIKSFQKEMKALAPDGTRNPTPAEGIARPPGVDPLLADRIETSTDPDVDPQPAERQE